MCEPSTDAISISENLQKRSDIVCNLIKKNGVTHKSRSESKSTIPKIIVQYWDDPNHIPGDVQKCLETWDHLSSIGCKHILFNDHSARRFITKNFSRSHVEAYDRCYHPAMKSDYFRLCFILLKGGCYVDADDAYCGKDFLCLFSDLRLKLQPLCYDFASGEMIEPEIFTKPNQYSHDWLFYFGNNPIVAPPWDRVVRYALGRATRILLKSDNNSLPEIQSATGPGNLTASLVAYAATGNTFTIENQLMVLSNWKSFARTVWPLSYRNDRRNWRLSNRQRFLKQK